MSKTAFLFAGQGAAYTGMGKDLCEQYKAARMVFEAGSDILGFDIARLCFEADNDTLAQTGNTQPAIFTMSLASCAVLEEKGVRADCAAGFSLGEISALAAAGAVELEDGFRIIQARGACMQKAAERTSGAMYAILGLDSARIQEVCEETAGYVLPVNYNSPARTVIAGEEGQAQAARRVPCGRGQTGGAACGQRGLSQRADGGGCRGVQKADPHGFLYRSGDPGLFQYDRGADPGFFRHALLSGPADREPGPVAENRGAYGAGRRHPGDRARAG